jgi:hypothetical protein
MAIQPIDLQVLFSRLSEVGKEQAAQQAAVTRGQETAASEIVEEAEMQERAVNETEELQDGTENVNDESGSGSQAQAEGESLAHEETEDEASIFDDPDLGRNIDISG